MTVVGIVGDLRYRDLKTPPPAVYIPLRQSSFPARFLIVRASVAQAPVLAMTQRALNEIDPAEPVTEAASVADLLASELAAPQFQMSALLLFASLAVLLGGVGVFGVLAAFVAQRSRDVGLRIALGANLSRIRWLVLSRVGWPAALGLTAGTFAAFAAGPLLRPLFSKWMCWTRGRSPQGAASWRSRPCSRLLCRYLGRFASIRPLCSGRSGGTGHGPTPTITATDEHRPTQRPEPVLC